MSPLDADIPPLAHEMHPTKLISYPPEADPARVKSELHAHGNALLLVCGGSLETWHETQHKQGSRVSYIGLPDNHNKGLGLGNLTTPNRDRDVEVSRNRKDGEKEARSEFLRLSENGRPLATFISCVELYLTSYAWRGGARGGYSVIMGVVAAASKTYY